MSITVKPYDPKEARTISIGAEETKKPSQNTLNIDSKAPTIARTEDPATSATPKANQEPISRSSERSEAPDAKEADPRMMELLRKEMLLREEARRVKAEKEAVEQARSQRPSGMTAEEWKKAFLEDPTKVGLDLQQIADRYLNAPSETDQKTSKLEQEVAQLRQVIEDNRKQLEAAQQQAYENAKKQFLTDAKRIAGANPDKYEAIAADGAYDAVIGLIEATYQEDNVLMSVEDAMSKVEDYLTERALKYAGLKKVRGAVDKAPGSSTPQAEMKTQEQPQTQARTASLSHSMVQSSRTLTPAERRERAIRIAMGQKPE